MVSEIDINSYKLAISKTDNKNIYHSEAWLNLLAQYYHFKVKIIQKELIEDKFAVVPFLICSTLFGKDKLINLPFTDQIEILGNDKNCIKELISYLIKYKCSQYRKIVFHSDISEFVSPEFVNKIFIDNSFVKHTIEIKDENEILFSKNCNRNINKAKKNQILIKRSVDEKTLKDFYDLHLLTRKKHGTPIQPYGFFKKLKELIFDKGNGVILTAYKDEIPLASAIFLFDNLSMIYKYGASNPKLLHFRPNEILFYEAIKMAKEKKLKTFDFGISKIGNLGLRHFKSGFGTTETPVSYSIMSNNPLKKKGKTGDNNVIKFIIRHSPLWVNRLIGELFYKYAA